MPFASSHAAPWMILLLAASAGEAGARPKASADPAVASAITKVKTAKACLDSKPDTLAVWQACLVGYGEALDEYERAACRPKRPCKVPRKLRREPIEVRFGKRIPATARAFMRDAIERIHDGRCGSLRARVSFPFNQKRPHPTRIVDDHTWDETCPGRIENWSWRIRYCRVTRSDVDAIRPGARAMHVACSAGERNPYRDEYGLWMIFEATDDVWRWVYAETAG